MNVESTKYSWVLDNNGGNTGVDNEITLFKLQAGNVNQLWLNIPYDSNGFKTRIHWKGNDNNNIDKYCLSLKGNSPVLNICVDSPEQQWVISKYRQLVNINGKCLARVKDKPHSTSGNIKLTDCQGKDNQLELFLFESPYQCVDPCVAGKYDSISGDGCECKDVERGIKYN